MRRLTALDALFLAAENDRTHGHVSALGVFDPVTASGRPLDAALVRELVTERITSCPPCGGDWLVCLSASTIRTSPVLQHRCTSPERGSGRNSRSPG